MFHALALCCDGRLMQLASLSFIWWQVFNTNSVFFNWLKKMVNNRYPKYPSIQNTALQNLAEDLFHTYRTEDKKWEEKKASFQEQNMKYRPLS